VIGSRVPEADPSAPIQTVLETVIDYLRGQIAQVLPDKPDLIVLPEMCDRTLMSRNNLDFIVGAATGCWNFYPEQPANIIAI